MSDKQAASAKKIEHKLSPAWAQHVQETLAQIQHAEQQAWILDGQAAHNRREAETMKRHLRVLIDQTAAAEKLPKPVVPYELSADGSALVGVITEGS